MQGIASSVWRSSPLMALMRRGPAQKCRGQDHRQPFLSAAGQSIASPRARTTADGHNAMICADRSAIAEKRPAAQIGGTARSAQGQE
jgi:hypothetical protein